MKEIIFISHANPQDNEFVIWLASKLECEGYKVWFDLEELIGGEDTWASIAETIEHKSIKFLFVYSKDSIVKQGTLRELAFANSKNKKNNIKDFIIPLKIDKTEFDESIELVRTNFIDFHSSWAEGLIKLFRKLDKDNIPKNFNENSSIGKWIGLFLKPENLIFSSEEEFFSNWLYLNDFPETLYIHTYSNEKQAQALKSYGIGFPIISHDNHIVTFSKLLPHIKIDEGLFSQKVAPISSISCSINRIFENDLNNQSFPNNKDIRNFIVRLIKTSIYEHLTDKLSLGTYELSGSTICFYHKNNAFEKNKVKYILDNRKNTKQINGRYYTSIWHFALSFKPFFYNNKILLGFKSHILFSENGIDIWDDKASLHSARRKKGKTFFNKDWRELVIAFLHSLNLEDKEIKVKITSDSFIKMPIIPIVFKSDKGYNDPKGTKTIETLAESFEFEEEEEGVGNEVE